MNQTDTLLLRCAYTVKATGCVSMVRVHRALTALLEPLARDDHDLAHNLGCLTKLFINNYSFWVSWTLTPDPIGVYAFDHAPVGDSLAAIARATICAAFDSLEDAIEEGGDEGKIEISKYFDARDVIAKLRLAALKRFNALNNA